MKKYSLIFLLGNLSVWQLSSLNKQFLIYLVVASFILILAATFLAYSQKSYQLNERFSKQNLSFSLILALIFFNLAFINTWFQAKQRLSLALPVEIEAKEILVKGQINSIPSYHKQTRWLPKNKKERYQAKFIFKLIEAPDSFPDYAKGRVKISWYKLTLAQVRQLKIGQIWTLKIKIKPPSGLLNPGSFDYEKWLFQQNIQATGYVRDGEENLLLSNNHISPYSISSFRQSLADNLRRILPEDDFKGIYLALSLGLKEDITDKQWQVLTETGTNHLMAISGLHIGLIAGLGFLLGRLIWPFTSSLFDKIKIDKVNRPHFSSYFAIFFALIYAALAGFAIPTQRALIMLVILVIGIIYRYKIHPLNILAGTLIVVLAWDPFSSLSIGFWLSFAAVAVILLSLSAQKIWIFNAEKIKHSTTTVDKSAFFNKLGTGVKSLILIQVVLFVGLLPFTVLFFDRFSLVSPIANFILVPVMSFLVIPFTIIASLLSVILPEISMVIFQFVNALMQILWMILNELVDISNNLIYLSHFQLMLIILLVLTLGITIFYLKVKKGSYRLRLVIVSLVVFTGSFVLVQRANRTLDSGQFSLQILDVGQGLSTVIQTKNHTLVYDTGNAFSDRFNMADQVLLPFLRHKEIDKIDRLILSHADHDHAAASQKLIQKINVDEIFSGEVKRVADKFKVDTQACIRGQQWQWDGVTFRVISPFKKVQHDKSNNRSCVILISDSQGYKVLLPGDIEALQEKRLLADSDYAEQLKNIDVIVAPHHGSNTSSSTEFVQHLKPEYVIFTNAYKHFFNFPNPKVVQRYKDVSAKQESTSNGSIEILSPSNQLDDAQISIYRKHFSRLWNRKYRPVDSLQY